MRRRLLWSTVAVVAVAVVLLGGPLAVAVDSLLTARALDQLQAQGELIQATLNQPSTPAGSRPALLSVLSDRTGARFVLIEAGSSGVALIDTGSPPALPDGLQSELAEATRGSVTRTATGGVLAVSVPLRAGDAGQILWMVTDDSGLRSQVYRAWAAIAGLAVTALGVAALVAARQGDRLAGPVEQLASAARRLGEGDFSARAPRSGVTEADEVATALDVTAERLAAMLERSRALGADASHQLRTPLTALRLDLEALQVGGGADPDLVDASLAEVNRLEKTIEELSRLAGPAAGDERTDLGALTAARLDAWRSLARAAGRDVVLHCDDVPPARARSAAAGQALQVLLDNALEHGLGQVSVAVTAARRSGWVRLCVSDEGPGIDDDLLATSSDGGSRGLPLARSLVEAEGGRLRLSRAGTGTRACILLPAA